MSIEKLPDIKEGYHAKRLGKEVGEKLLEIAKKDNGEYVNYGIETLFSSEEYVIQCFEECIKIVEKANSDIESTKNKRKGLKLRGFMLLCAIVDEERPGYIYQVGENQIGYGICYCSGSKDKSQFWAEKLFRKESIEILSCILDDKDDYICDGKRMKQETYEAHYAFVSVADRLLNDRLKEVHVV